MSDWLKESNPDTHHLHKSFQVVTDISCRMLSGGCEGSSRESMRLLQQLALKTRVVTLCHGSPSRLESFALELATTITIMLPYPNYSDFSCLGGTLVFTNQHGGIVRTAVSTCHVHELAACFSAPAQPGEKVEAFRCYVALSTRL